MPSILDEQLPASLARTPRPSAPAQTPTPQPIVSAAPHEPASIIPEAPVSTPLQQKPLPPLKQPPQNDGRQSAIRTLQGDIASTVHSQNLSVADIALAQQRRSREASDAAPMDAAPRDRGNVWWILGALAFIFLGVGVATAVVYFLPDTNDIVVETPAGMLLPADEVRELDITGMTFDGLSNAIRAFAPTAGNPGTLTLISLVEGGRDSVSIPITTERFFELLHSRAPARLVRSLNDSFALGVATTDTPSVFLIFKTNAYENAFAGMLEWERLMADDLPFIAAQLPVPPAMPEAIAATSSATSTLPAATSTTPLIVSEEAFKDIVVQNKDVRALFFTDGSSRIVYAFPDKETLVITLDEKAFAQIFERLSAARFTR